jgi:hypothetical protein
MSSEAEKIKEAAQASASAPAKILGGSAQDMVQPSLPSLPPEAAERVKLASATDDQLEEQIKKILAAQKAAEAKAQAKPTKPAEPDWANLSELEATDIRRNLNIPVITHEVPAYLDIKLADNEYIAVWANRDQRRIGELEAQGYEFLRKEHISSAFKLPLKFNSEGLYIYADVVAMRVHKRIIFGKRRRTQEMSVNQLKGAQQIAKNKIQSTVIEKDSDLEQAFGKGSLNFYDVNI